jgi:ribonuclease P protein component
MVTKKHQFTLKSNERLKHRKKIDALFSKGQKFSLGLIRVVYQPSTKPASALNPLQIGVGVSKRYFKKAVDRNRMKRLLRESVRLEKKPLQDCLERTGAGLDLFILYTGKEKAGFDQCRELVQTAFQKLIRKCASAPTNNEHP